MELKHAAGIIGILLVGLSCSREPISDAFGQFEAETITISAETSGILKNLEIEEGKLLDEGQYVGQIDSIQLHLKKEELVSVQASIAAKIDNLNAQASVLNEQLQIATTEWNRIRNLQESGAATQQQLDQVKGEVQVLKKQLNSLEVQKTTVRAEMHTVQTRIEQVKDQIRRTRILNPVSGTVLNVYAKAHELVTTGKPLYELADLKEMTLKVYISGAQLPEVRLGQKVEVIIDKNAEDTQRLEGAVTWIASRAEFTPRMIQTKEERVTQVYAVEVRVRNPDGKLKIGMPGEVNFE